MKPSGTEWTLSAGDALSALLGDLKIDPEEARRIAPVAARAMRLLSPFLESLDTQSAGRPS